MFLLHNTKNKTVYSPAQFHVILPKCEDTKAGVVFTRNMGTDFLSLQLETGDEIN